MSTAALAPAPRPAAQSARNRQVAYALAILLLFGAMWPYSEWLQKVKQREDLGEATIGQIDAGSFMLKLAMIGGARGVVANALWMRAQDLQKVHEWDKLRATVDLITKLQPHFLSIWTFQGWNLSYNVAVEWDAPDDKYFWIKQGIQFLKEGVAKNRRSPDLMWDTAWTYYHKLGFADEAILLRRLFYDDPDDDGGRFKIDPKTDQSRNDNFQVAYGWFTTAVELVDRGIDRVSTNIEQDVEYVDKPNQRKGRPGDLAFRSQPAHAQTRYASALEKQSIKDIDPIFGEVAQAEWDKALREWLDFGRYEFDTPNQIPINGQLVTQKVRIEDSTDPTARGRLHENVWHWTDRWADQQNYRYWKDRCLTERTKEGARARQLFYEGTIAIKSANFPRAVEKFREGLDLWADLLKDHPQYRNDDLNKKDTGHLVKRYAFALRQTGALKKDAAGVETLPEGTPFLDLYEAVKNDKTLDPFDQLDMMREIPKNAAGGGRAAQAAPAGK